jgi:hypothetical protein
MLYHDFLKVHPTTNTLKYEEGIKPWIMMSFAWLSI